MCCSPVGGGVSRWITGEVAFRLSAADFSVAMSPGAGTVFPKFQLLPSAASWATARRMALTRPRSGRNVCACAARCGCRKCSAANQTTGTVGAGFLDGS